MLLPKLQTIAIKSLLVTAPVTWDDRDPLLPDELELDIIDLGLDTVTGAVAALALLFIFALLPLRTGECGEYSDLLEAEVTRGVLFKLEKSQSFPSPELAKG